MTFVRWLLIWLGMMVTEVILAAIAIALSINEVAPVVSALMALPIAMLAGFILGWPIFGVNYLVWTWQLRVEGKQLHRGWKQADDE